MAGHAIETILHNPHLPSLPTVAIQVLELTRSQNVNMQEIARVIENDQALALKVIRTVNSSYYGLSKPCTTIRQAIVYLGLNTVKTLVLGFSLLECVDGGCDDYIGFDYVDYWRRALYSAVAAREIAAMTGNLDPEETFLAAMVQDIGMIAMYRTYKDLYLQVIDMTSGLHATLPVLEQQSFKTDHAEVGAAVAEYWKMPHQLVQSIRYHHAVASGPSEMKLHLRTLELAQQGAALASATDRHTARAEFDRLARKHFGCTRPQVHRLIEVMIESATNLTNLFKLDTGDVPEASALLADAESQQVQHQAAVLREAEMLRRAGDSNATEQQMIDPVTHLPGPASFWKTLRQAFDAASCADQQLAVIFCRLGSVSDDTSCNGSHEAHARALMTSGRLLQKRAGSDCIVHRYDLNRFALIVPNADRREAANRAEQLLRGLEVELKDCTAALTSDGATAKLVSFGVAALEPDTREILTCPELLVGYADQALQAADRAADMPVRVFVSAADRIQAA